MGIVSFREGRRRTVCSLLSCHRPTGAWPSPVPEMVLGYSEPTNHGCHGRKLTQSHVSSSIWRVRGSCEVSRHDIAALPPLMCRFVRPEDAVGSLFGWSPSGKRHKALLYANALAPIDCGTKMTDSKADIAEVDGEVKPLLAPSSEKEKAAACSVSCYSHDASSMLSDEQLGITEQFILLGFIGVSSLLALPQTAILYMAKDDLQASPGTWSDRPKAIS